MHVKNPYSRLEKDNMEIFYERYSTDSSAIITIDEKTYYKIKMLSQFDVGKRKVSVVMIDRKLGVQVGEELVDENGRIYEVKGFPLIRFATAEIPHWFSKVAPVEIAGDVENMGDYLARCKGRCV